MKIYTVHIKTALCLFGEQWRTDFLLPTINYKRISNISSVEFYLYSVLNKKSRFTYWASYSGEKNLTEPTWGTRLGTDHILGATG